MNEESDMPPIRTEADQQLQLELRPAGGRCDGCGQLMVPHLMTVADHIAWERGWKCADCYKRSIFKDEVKEFERLVKSKE